jgi:hypothetical protein
MAGVTAYVPCRADVESSVPARSSRMNGLFRFSEAVRRDPAIDAWLAGQAPELGAIARRWFARMRNCGRDVREVMHDGCPTACVQDAAFGYVGVFTAHANVGFFRGAELQDPRGLLQGSGKRMRHVKVKPGIDVDPAALDALIRAAYADIKRRPAPEQSVGIASSLHSGRGRRGAAQEGDEADDAARRRLSELGFPCPRTRRANIEARDDVALLLFVHDRRVARHLAQKRSKGDFSRLHHIGGYARAEAVFEVDVSRGWPFLLWRPGGPTRG